MRVKLSKVIKDLNVGLQTIQDFFAKKKIELEVNPNTKIPEDILEELEEKGITVPDDKDSLGLNDFGPGSGWMYKVNGSAPNKYMDKVDPKDGSTVEIYYTISGMD